MLMNVDDVPWCGLGTSLRREPKKLSGAQHLLFKMTCAVFVKNGRDVASACAPGKQHSAKFAREARRNRQTYFGKNGC